MIYTIKVNDSALRYVSSVPDGIDINVYRCYISILVTKLLLFCLIFHDILGYGIHHLKLNLNEPTQGS